MARRVRRKRSVFRWLLGLFPAEFRRDFGEQMFADFREQEADAAIRGREDLSRLRVRTIIDWARRAPIEHLDILRRDAGYGLRLLRRRPALAGAVILTLAVGIGANAAVFSVVSGVLLKDLPFANDDRVVRVITVKDTAPNDFNDVSSADYLDWQAQTKTLDRMALSSFAGGTVLVPGGEPESMLGLIVTDGFFDIIGTTPVLGRTFTADEYRDGTMVNSFDDRAGVALISDGFWHRQFGGRPDVVGTTFRIDQRVLQVVGVMPASVDLRGISRVDHPQFWLPGRPNTAGAMGVNRRNRGTGAIGRLVSGVSLANAQAEFDAISASINAVHPETAGWSVRLMRPLDNLVAGVRTQVRLLALAALCVLMIAAANVANLMLAHASGRRLEMATRVAMGATRAHLIRQLLTEALALSVLGGAFGVVLAYWVVPALVALAPPTVPRLNDIVVDGRVVVFALAMSVITGVACALTAALAPDRWYVQAALRGGRLDGRSQGQAIRRGLTVAQVALALLLVVATGLVGRTILALNAQELGFDPRNVLSVSANTDDGAMLAEFVAQVRQLTGVVDAGTGPRPLKGATGTTVSSEPGRMGEPTEVNPVTPGYLRVLRSRLIRGRLLEDRDGPASEAVAVVTDSAARQFWPDIDPLGRRLYMGGNDSATVVGVVADIRRDGLTGEFAPVVYLPSAQTRRFGIGTLWIRTERDPHAMVPAVRAVLKRLNPEAPLVGVQALEEAIDAELAPHRFVLSLVGLFSTLALVLALLGVYGVLAESVAQRVPEIGVRVALGATPRGIAVLVLSQGGRMIGLGIAIGATTAYLLRDLMSDFVFGVPTSDVLTYAWAAATVTLAALGASWLPARRAAAVDPVVALRQE